MAYVYFCPKIVSLLRSRKGNEVKEMGAIVSTVAGAEAEARALKDTTEDVEALQREKMSVTIIFIGAIVRTGRAVDPSHLKTGKEVALQRETTKKTGKDAVPTISPSTRLIEPGENKILGQSKC
jgi:hypothetical protein